MFFFPPVILVLRFRQESRRMWLEICAKDLGEREKNFVCYCLFRCLRKIVTLVMSGLLVCFVRSDLF